MKFQNFGFEPIGRKLLNLHGKGILSWSHLDNFILGTLKFWSTDNFQKDKTPKELGFENLFERVIFPAFLVLFSKVTDSLEFLDYYPYK